MVEDSRETSKKDSNTISVPSGDNSVQDVIELGAEETLSPEYLKVDYSPAGTTTAEVVFYDDPIGTGSGDVSDERERQYLSGGDTLVLDDVTLEDFENGVLVLPDGAQDAAINITVGGFLTTS